MFRELNEVELWDKKGLKLTSDKITENIIKPATFKRDKAEKTGGSMSYFRKRDTEQTGFQEAAQYHEDFDVKCDFVMVYGIDASMPERVKCYREKGYVVHLMTGIAWGEYQDYLNGEFDGRKHWDEAQRDAFGNEIAHGPEVPYMVPTIAFAEFITERLKNAVAAGVEAIHLEEPEFWDRGGYSEAFRREYEGYYKTVWVDPETDVTASYRSAKLKAYLYTRTIGRVFDAVKEYGKTVFQKNIRFYVPTHSLLNYTQWKILSPEGALTALPGVDGYIAQIWTGTSRTENIYEGVMKERTLETAFLEYGVMQELVAGTDRRMWFLHDPIEDNAGYTWENYEYNYRKTLVASLLHPKVSRYEICPWPNRVIHGEFPRERGKRSEQAKPIPERYRTVLNNIFQMLGDMDQTEIRQEAGLEGVGILVSDTMLYQRTCPQDCHDRKPAFDLIEDKNSRARKENFEQLNEEEERLFRTSIALPDFYGLALPLLKYGLCVRPVLLDNVARYADSLKGFHMLILSYEYFKPESMGWNLELAAWVKQGGTLIYIGDGSDPFHAIDSWWKTYGYDTPARHLFETLGCPNPQEGETITVGKGIVTYLKKRPSELCKGSKEAENYRLLVQKLLQQRDIKWTFTNCLALRRGPYLIAAVMEESLENTYRKKGFYVDMLSEEFTLVKEFEVHPDEVAVMYDLSWVSEQDYAVIGTSCRLEELYFNHKNFEFRAAGPAKLTASLRCKLPKCPAEILANGEKVFWCWDEESKTVLIRYPSKPEGVTIVGKY